MKTDIDYLPPQKQRELERVVQLIFEEFEDAFALAKHDWKKAGRILKVILYGSYARGTWVDEPHTAKGYQSDYDLLIIVNDKRLTDRVKYWAKLDDRLMREYGIDAVIAKNSGGSAAAGKLAAARTLGLPVYMFARPALPPAPSVADVPAALTWIDHWRASGTARAE